MKQIDDTMLWGNNMAEIYEQTIEYLKIVGENGVILNKKKFSFGNDEVDYGATTWQKYMNGPSNILKLWEKME